MKVCLSPALDSIELNPLVNIVVQDKPQDPKFVKHVLTYATNIERVTFGKREKFTSNFTHKFTSFDQDCKLIAPYNVYKKIRCSD